MFESQPMQFQQSQFQKSVSSESLPSSISNGCVVSIDYRVSDAEGHFIASSEADKSLLNYIHGFRQIIIGLENFLAGKAVGFSGEVTIKAEEAYGQYDESNVVVAKREHFPEDEQLEVGDQVQGTGEHAHYFFLVKEVNDEEIILDANHPLANRDLIYQVSVKSIRQASDAELNSGEIHDHPNTPSA